MKNLWKFLILSFLVVLCMVCGRPGTAEAAYTTDGTYYPDILAIETCFEDLRTLALDTCEYFFVLKKSDREYQLGFIDSSNIDNIGYLWTKDSTLGFYYSHLFNLFFDVYWQIGSVFGGASGQKGFVPIGSEDSGFNLIGTNFPLYKYYLDATGGIELPQNNLSFPGSGGIDVPVTSVTLSAGGTEYTVKEPYPYYFVSYAYDSVRLFFTEEPFTAYWADLYTFNLYPGKQCVVCYQWSREENNDFLSSRTTEALGLPYKHPASADYSSNYDVLSSKDSGRVCLPEKPVYPLADTVYSAFTEEMSGYKHCIILRQPHEDAFTNDIVCYLWNDSNANLIIRWGDSCIAAARKGVPVTDYLAARYDLKTGTWNIDKNTPISRCKNDVYNIPYIYYSTSDLYVQQAGQTGWYPSAMCMYIASLEAPSFNPDAPGQDFEEKDEIDTGIGWLDSLLKGFGNLLDRLFVPSSSFLDKKVDALTSRFSFWKSVYDTVDVFMDFLRGTDFTVPPKVSMNFKNVKSEISYGSSAFVLDLSWYQPYKADVDVFLSAVLWAVFVWNTFKNLPNTIRGVGDGVFVVTSSSPAGGSTKEGKK